MTRYRNIPNAEELTKDYKMQIFQMSFYVDQNYAGFIKKLLATFYQRYFKQKYII